MEKNNELKKKNEMSASLLRLFLLLCVLAGIGIYFLPNYYFLKPSEEFDLDASFKPVLKKKIESLKSYDFSIFNSSKFTSLKEGYWHIYDESNLVKGNSNPFLEAK